MNNLKIHSDPRVREVFARYPEHVRPRMDELRAIILETATLAGITELEETLKWGEPSYLVKGGSTVRIDWKARSPDQCAIYFKCTSALVPSFRRRYAEGLHFDGNRAIVLDIKAELPKDALINCVTAALRYHKVKSMPDLGMQ